MRINFLSFDNYQSNVTTYDWLYTVIDTQHYIKG